VRVWVSRSSPGADRLSEFLVTSGYEVVCQPVITIEPIMPKQRTLEATDLIFLSEHAVTLGYKYLQAADFDFSLARTFAIGPTTAAKLKNFGLRPIVPAEHSSEGLLALSGLTSVSGREILLLSGEGGRDILEAELSQRGAKTTKVSLYRREPANVDLLKRVIRPDAIDVIVVGSGEGLRQVASIWFHLNGDSKVFLVAPSSRVALIAKDLGFLRVATALGAKAKEVLKAIQGLD